MRAFLRICGALLLLVHSYCVAAEHHEYDQEISSCASSVHPETMKAVISTESQWQQFAVADAGKKGLPWATRKALVKSYYFATQSEAVEKTRSLLQQGHTVSLGLTQINDRNLNALGLDIEQAFDVCHNLAGGAKILTYYYSRAVRAYGETPQALRAALSGYNSGDWKRGEKDGYVDLVYLQANKPGTALVHQASIKALQKKQASNNREFTLLIQEFE